MFFKNQKKKVGQRGKELREQSRQLGKLCKFGQQLNLPKPQFPHLFNADLQHFCGLKIF